MFQVTLHDSDLEKLKDIQCYLAATDQPITADKLNKIIDKIIQQIC